MSCEDRALVSWPEERGPGCSLRPQSPETAVGAGRTASQAAGPGRGLRTDPHRRAASRAALHERPPARVQIAGSGSAPLAERLPRRPREPASPGTPRGPSSAGPAQGARAPAPREAQRPPACRLGGARGLHGDGRGDARPTPAGVPVGRRARSPWRRPRGRAPNARRGPQPRPPAQMEAGGRQGPGALGGNAEAGRPLPRPWDRDERPHPGDPPPSVPRGLRRPTPAAAATLSGGDDCACREPPRCPHGRLPPSPRSPPPRAPGHKRPAGKAPSSLGPAASPSQA
ncbi:basic proline-rich protein-like [Budorcas taxicolor]|uniref:basic proline-rich protein-like n=1 Tax=Budorcas taxicolor TaxID=37181 RepID=UPI0022835230|nr:basic proline-rich protein-like [Budorcas taxicolor]